MKSRIIPVLIVANTFLIFYMLFPLPVFGQEVSNVPIVKIAGQTLAPGESVSDGKDGSIFLSKDNKTLTIKNFDINYSDGTMSDFYICINENRTDSGDITLKLVGKNNFTLSNSSLICMNTGKLNIISNNACLNVTLSNDYSRGIACAENMTITGGTYKFIGCSIPIFGLSEVNLTDVNISLTANDKTRFFLLAYGPINVNKSLITIFQPKREGDNLTVTRYFNSPSKIHIKDSFVSIDGDESQGNIEAMEATSSILIENSYVNIQRLPIGFSTTSFTLNSGKVLLKNCKLGLLSDTITVVNKNATIETVNSIVKKNLRCSTFCLNGSLKKPETAFVEDSNGVVQHEKDKPSNLVFSENVLITGAGRPAPSPSPLRVYISNGATSDKYSACAGEVISIVAKDPAKDMRFKEWSIMNGQWPAFTQGTFATDQQAKFIMPYENVGVQPIYEGKITVAGGSAHIDYAVRGEVVSLLLDESKIPSGKQFKEWNISPNFIYEKGFSKNQPFAKILMPDKPVYASAIYEDKKYNITLTDGFTNVTQASFGTQVSLSLDENKIPFGWVFKEWVSQPSVDFTKGTDKTKTPAVLIMPNQPVKIYATFERLPPLTVVGPKESAYEAFVYWNGVLTALQKAKSGTIVTTDPKYLENMPVGIMNYLGDCGKSLTLRLNYQGEIFDISSNKAVTPEANREAYTLQELLINYRK